MMAGASPQSGLCGPVLPIESDWQTGFGRPDYRATLGIAIVEHLEHWTAVLPHFRVSPRLSSYSPWKAQRH